MAEIIATRTMTVLGKEYKAGDRIPAEHIAPIRLNQLIKQRRVEESRVETRRSKKEG